MRKAAGPRSSGKAVRSARKRRREMSLPEYLLWEQLRQRPQGLKFRHEHPVGEDLSLDFYCNDARLAIEVDGEAHERGDRPQRDARRDAFLASHGIHTWRVTAKDILRNLDGVMSGLLDVVMERLPLHHPAKRGGPPPRDELGEE